MTLHAFLKSYLFLKIWKYEFKKKDFFLYFDKSNVRSTIFFWEYTTCYWLINENTKNSEKKHVAYF